MKNGLEFICEYSVAWSSYRLYVRDAASKTVAAPLLMQGHSHELGKHIEPLVGLSPEEAEQLMTELWNAGVRPRGRTDASISAEVGAVKYHLEDMRKLVFNK